MTAKAAVRSAAGVPAPALTTTSTSTLPQVKQLAAELESKGSAKANNAALLIAVLSQSKDQDVLKAAIQGLKIFFVDTSQEGDLGSKKPKATAEVTPGSQGSTGGAEDVYRQWLQRQYSQYTSALLALLMDSAVTPGTQISAASAAMEAVRCEQGVGVFSIGLYLQLLTALVTSTAVQPEVFTFMFTRYFQYTDVRYYTLWAVREIALLRARQPPAGQAAGTGSGGGTGSGEPTAAAAGSSRQKATEQRKPAAAAQSAPRSKRPASALESGVEAPPEDIARTLFDVLVNVPETIGAAAEEGEAGAGAGGAGAGRMQSWCGIEEAQELRPTADKSESSKARRKRKAQEAEEGLGQEAKTTTQKTSWANVKAHKRMFSDAWVSYLQLPIPADIYRKVLLRLHAAVLPNMVNPLMLADFLTYALNQGGITGMLALNGIFLLVTQHGLEYALFYERLYQLITAEAFAAKHRAHFFKLADLFLSSGLVPAYTAAAFIKKMARLGMCAPPSGAMTAIAFIHNLIRRHPACVVLMDRPPAAADAAPAAAAAGEDVFDVDQPDPAKSRALGSSLWELVSLRNHYCPQVAALCAVLDKDLTNRSKTSEVDVDPLLASSYTSLFTQEVERRLKQVPLAFYQQPPKKLFDANSHADFGGWSL